MTEPKSKRVIVKPEHRGTTDSRCNYMAPASRVCNKCGRLHDGRLAPFFQPPTPYTPP